MIYGAEVLTACLEALGVEHVFGLPGTQNLAVFEALRRSRLRAVVASDEMAATFMACGYARAGGRLGVVTTIPGPGFTYALTALAEARADSAPLLYITLRQVDSGRRFQLQLLDQVAIARTVVKQCLLVDQLDALPETVFEGARRALQGEPGPVMIEILAPLLSRQLDRLPAISTGGADDRTVRADADFDRAGFAAIDAMLRGAQRPLVLAGQGAHGVAEAVRRWCEARRAVCLSTGSGRGVIPESHPLCLPLDLEHGGGELVNEVLRRADAVLVLGAKLGYNGSHAYTLALEPGSCAHVDSSADVPGANFPVRHALVASAEEFMQQLAAQPPAPASAWAGAEFETIRARAAQLRQRALPKDAVLNATGAPLRAWLGTELQSLPAETIITTDSGSNQAVTRSCALVRRTRGMIVPADFQSMGFGIPAAIGAKLACPQAPVLACVGDGGLLQTATELLSAVRESVTINVLVFDDGKFGYIEDQQVEKFGTRSGTRLGNVDYHGIAAAFDLDCIELPGTPLADALRGEGRVLLLDMALRESTSSQWYRTRRKLRESLARSPARSLLRRALQTVQGK